MTRRDVLGLEIDRASTEDACAEIVRRVAERRRGYACLVNVHVAEIARRSPGLRNALENADLLLPDGAPIAWAAGLRRRVTGTDLFEGVLAASAERGIRNYLFGTTAETLTRLARAVEARYGTSVLCGWHAPPRLELGRLVHERDLEAISRAKPDVVWVALGAPKQELWMAAARPHIRAPVLVGVGAAFDFAAGTRVRAPGWMQRLGLEWFHRLASEPARLGPRYLTTNTTFALAIAREAVASLRSR